MERTTTETAEAIGPPGLSIRFFFGGLRTLHPSDLFVVLVAIAALSNLGASVATSTAFSVSRESVLELNPLVRPGSIMSLSGTELLIVLGAIMILYATKEDSDRVVLQSMVTGLTLADAFHDAILLLTNDPYVSSTLPLWIGASVPSLCAIREIRKLLLRVNLASRQTGLVRPIPQTKNQAGVLNMLKDGEQ